MTSRDILMRAGYLGWSCSGGTRPCSSPTPNCSRSGAGCGGEVATPVRWLVVAAEPVTGIDVTAGDMVAESNNALHAMGIALCFAELKDPVKDKLKRFGLFAQLGESFFFPTIGVAVSVTLSFTM